MRLQQIQPSGQGRVAAVGLRRSNREGRRTRLPWPADHSDYLRRSTPSVRKLRDSCWRPSAVGILSRNYQDLCRVTFRAGEQLIGIRLVPTCRGRSPWGMDTAAQTSKFLTSKYTLGRSVVVSETHPVHRASASDRADYPLLWRHYRGGSAARLECPSFLLVGLDASAADGFRERADL